MAAMKFFCIGAAETAVHALTLLQGGIGNIDGAHQSICTARRKRAEFQDDGRNRCYRGTFEIDGAERQSAGEATQSIIHEQTATVILPQQHSHDFSDDFLGVGLGRIDEVDAAVGCDNHLGRCRIFANQTVRLARPESAPASIRPAKRITQNRFIIAGLSPIYAKVVVGSTCRCAVKKERIGIF